MSQNDTLSKNQKRAIEALLVEPTITAAATRAKLARRTLHRYLGNVAFRAELRKRQSETLAATVSALAGLSGDAVKVLREVMLDTGATHADRRQAAVSWLEYARRFVETDQILERLEDLESEIDTKR